MIVVQNDRCQKSKSKTNGCISRALQISLLTLPIASVQGLKFLGPPPENVGSLIFVVALVLVSSNEIF